MPSPFTNILDNLPTEILVLICENLTGKDTVSLTTTCQEFNGIFSPILYSKDMVGPRISLFWSAENGNIGTLKKALTSRPNIDPSVPIFNSLQGNIRSLPIEGIIAQPEGEVAEYLGSTSPPNDLGRYKAFMTRCPDLAPVQKDTSDGESEETCPFRAWDIVCSEWAMLHSPMEMLTYYTPLHMAALGGHVEAVKLLLHYGASFRATSLGLCQCDHHHDWYVWARSKDRAGCFGMPPLHVALCHGNHDAALVLAEAEARTPRDECPVNSRNEIGHKIPHPLGIHVAAMAGDVSLVKFFLENQKPSPIDLLDMTTPQNDDEFGYTPLSYAIRYHHWDVVDVLIDAGADINCGSSGYQFLWRTCKLGEYGLARKLVIMGVAMKGDHAADGPLPLYSAVQTDKAFAKELVAAGADVREFGIEGDGTTLPLSGAAKAGDLEMMQFLLDNGATVDDFGPADLHATPSPKGIKFFLDHGYKPAHRDESGYTLLHRLAYRWEHMEGKAEVVEMLIDHGTDPKEFVDSDNYTRFQEMWLDTRELMARPTPPLQFRPNAIVLATAVGDAGTFAVLQDHGCTLVAIPSEMRALYLYVLFKCLVSRDTLLGGDLAQDIARLVLDHDTGHWFFKEPRFIEHALHVRAFRLAHFMIDYKLKNKLPYRMINEYGRTPLHMFITMAAQERDTDATIAHMKAIAPAFDVNFFGEEAPLSDSNNYPAEYVTDGVEPEIVLPTGRVASTCGSALRMAVVRFGMTGGYRMAQACLDEGGDPHFMDKNGCTVFMELLFEEWLQRAGITEDTTTVGFNDMMELLLERFPLENVDRELVEVYHEISRAEEHLGAAREACEKVLGQPEPA